ncbi:MAG TPA: pantoate--beta-alanine ligase [Armatimonadota bacterium]|nr:pantoate--beta-alanine ligase [Armatimonadota bacterium]
MTDVVSTVAAVRNRVAAARAEGKSIGLVPTMGALHEGHLSLIARARAECGFVVVSVFVNPTQFAPGTDFEKYPRDLDSDAEKAGKAGADLIFAPSVEEMYPPGDSTFVEVTGPLVECLCGPHRRGHFRGVTTVCARLFTIVGADKAYFGEKDYQQLLVIERMVRDLKFPLEIVPVPTVREPDGLALSSRNAYLSPEERKAAVVLSRALFAARDLFNAGERDAAALLAATRDIIDAEPLVTLQYLELRDAETLEELHTLDRPALLAVAAFVGEARLIDNAVVGV